ncbi:uncharacterized protein LOC141850236 [Brevipalpus obovatus]|uniref:uncharacterized protein LOC141850236 n=1 Tax=Brevipalpus obovatus TaxID=246614 RepID=UPI003D9E85AE
MILFVQLIKLMTILLFSANCAINGEVILPNQHEPYQAILGNGILGIDPNSGSQASGEVWGIAPYESLDDVVNFPDRKVPQSALLPSPPQTMGHGQLIAPLWINSPSSVQPEFPLLSPIMGLNLASPLKRPKNKNKSNKHRTKNSNSNHNSRPHIAPASGEMMPMKVYNRPQSSPSTASASHTQPTSSSSNTASHTYDDRDKEISSEKDVEIVEESKYSGSKAKPLRRFGITKAIFKMFKAKDKPKGMPPVRHAHDHFHHEHLHHHHHHYHHHIHHYPGKKSAMGGWLERIGRRFRIGDRKSENPSQKNNKRRSHKHTTHKGKKFVYHHYHEEPDKKPKSKDRRWRLHFWKKDKCSACGDDTWRSKSHDWDWKRMDKELQNSTSTGPMNKQTIQSVRPIKNQ